MKVQLNICHTSCLRYQPTERPHVSIIHGDKLKQTNSDLDNSFKLLNSFSGQFEVGLCIERALLRGFVEVALP